MFAFIRKPSVAAVASVSTVIAAALAAGLTLFSLDVKAEPKFSVAAPSEQTSIHVKAHRLPVVEMGAACSSLGWPRYEQTCQFDRRRSAGGQQTVRIIALR